MSDLTPPEAEAMEADPRLRADRARAAVRTYAIVGVAPAVIPVPLADGALVFAVQLKLIHRLTRIYGVPFRPERARSVLAALAGGALSSMTGVTLARLVPGAGWAVGAVTAGALGGASTWAVGQLFVQHFESGGTLLTFDPEAVRGHYERLLREGQRQAAQREGPRKP